MLNTIKSNSLLSGILNDSDHIDDDDHEEPLVSESELGQQLKNVSLRALGSSAWIQVTHCLNIEQLITTDDGLARDYRGIAELMGFSYIELENFRLAPNPAKSLLDAYTLKSKRASINDLIGFLEKIERYDIIDDLIPHLHKAILNTGLTATTNGNQLKSCQEDGGNEFASEGNVNQSRNNLDVISKDLDQLTIDDAVNDQLDYQQLLPISSTPSILLSQQIYDAFVCYADEDADFVHSLIEYLEKEHDIRLTTKENLLPGHMEFDAVTQLIDKRCRRTMIILSPQFLKSSKCVFQSKFASALAYEQKIDTRKIIPVLHEPCDLPRTIRLLTKVDLTVKSRHNLEWSLKRLIASLKSSDNQPGGLSQSVNLTLAERYLYKENYRNHSRDPTNSLTSSSSFQYPANTSHIIDGGEKSNLFIQQDAQMSRQLGSSQTTNHEIKQGERNISPISNLESSVRDCESTIDGVVKGNKSDNDLIKRKIEQNSKLPHSSSMYHRWFKRIMPNKQRVIPIGDPMSTQSSIQGLIQTDKQSR